MKVKFKFTADDFVDTGRKLKAYSGYNQQVRIISLVGVILVGGGVLYLISSSWAVRAIGLITGICFVLLFEPDPLAKNLKKTYEKTYGSNQSIDTEVEISENGITYNQPDTKTILGWKTVKRIEEDDKSVCFYTEPDCVILVPARSFNSNEEKKRFIELTQSYIKKSSE